MQTITKPTIEIAAYPEMPPVAALLSKARAYLSEPEHWHKGDIGDGFVVCAAGAVAKFDGYSFVPCGRWEYSPTGVAARNFLQSDNLKLTSYNDDPSTTHADILALFDRAIAAALAAGQ